MNTQNVSRRNRARAEDSSALWRPVAALCCTALLGLAAESVILTGRAWSQENESAETANPAPSADDPLPEGEPLPEIAADDEQSAEDATSADRTNERPVIKSTLVRDLVLRKSPGIDLKPLQTLLDAPPVEELAPWLKDPFRHLEGEMQVVVNDLEIGELQRPAEVDQPRILSELDVLVKMLEKACKKSGSGSGPAGANPTRPMADSTLSGGPGGMGDLRAARKNQRKWADLTPKERQKILQSQTGEFPAGFEQILEDYYRQLATESSSESTSETEAPTSQP